MVRPISEDKKNEIIRLRNDEYLSCSEISVETGVCPDTVYKICRSCPPPAHVLQAIKERMQKKRKRVKLSKEEIERIIDLCSTYKTTREISRIVGIPKRTAELYCAIYNVCITKILSERMDLEIIKKLRELIEIWKKSHDDISIPLLSLENKMYAEILSLEDLVVEITGTMSQEITEEPGMYSGWLKIAKQGVLP